jgi:hypothetical protein
MTKIAFLFALLSTVLVCCLAAVPAQAQVNRTFVSGAGSDGNNCANVVTPCRHFATAYAATAPNGEIFVLDPANYGSLTITHGVNIEGHGWASIAPPNNGNAITINANPGDNISIHGVSINGTGATGNTNGIVFNSGASLTVTNCVVQNFVGILPTGNGILIQPTSGTVKLTITDTNASNNAGVGIFYVPPSGSPSANIVIDHVVATANQSGIVVNPGNASGGTVTAISNSVVSANSSDGLSAVNALAPHMISIDNVSAVGNGSHGIFAFGTPMVLLGRSVITGNGTGVANNTSPNTFYTYKDNRIDLNVGTDVSSPLNTTLAVQ